MNAGNQQSPYGFRYIVKGSRSADLMIRGINEIPLADIDQGRRIFSDAGVAIYQF